MKDESWKLCPLFIGLGIFCAFTIYAHILKFENYELTRIPWIALGLLSIPLFLLFKEKP